MAFKYTADYYDPSQPTEEEEGAKEPGETLLFHQPWRNCEPWSHSPQTPEQLSAKLSAPVFVSVEEAEPEVSEEPFVAPPGLAVPADVELVSPSRAEREDL